MREADTVRTLNCLAQFNEQMVGKEIIEGFRGIWGSAVLLRQFLSVAWLRAIALTGTLAILLVACAESGGPSGPGDPRQRASDRRGSDRDLPAPVALGDGHSILHMEGKKEPVRIGLLLPLTHNQQDVQRVGTALLNAAQLALFEIGNGSVLLIPKDTHGTPQGAEEAARAAISEGAEVLIGPLFSSSVRRAGAVARASNVPMIAFSTDRTVAGDGVYLLSFLPEQEVKRITDFAMSEGYFAFAALVPMSAYGDRVRRSFEHRVSQNGGVVTVMENYPRIAEEMFAPAKTVAEYDRRQRALKSKRDDAFEDQEGLTPGDNDDTETSMVFDPNTGEVLTAEEARARGVVTGQQTWGGVSYQAVLLPEGGTLLRSLAPLLPYFDVDPREVKFLGTGLWDDPTLGKEPSLVGGWYAAPAPKLRAAFAQRYESAFGESAPRIASIAFDATALASALARLPKRDRFASETLSNPNGFSGIDGIFRFLPDGSAERGLAILQVQKDGVEVISPAPTTFQKIEPLIDSYPPAVPGGDDSADLPEYGS